LIFWSAIFRQLPLKLFAAAVDARDRLRADIIVFPELTVTGYPPEDLLLRPGFVRSGGTGDATVTHGDSGITAVVGYPLP
jgi:NAD+ synthase (glutamine-hydrolysing)